MSYPDHDSRGAPAPGRRAPEPGTRTSALQAVWSSLTVLAIVFVLFVVFYGINAREERTTTAATRSSPVQTTSPTTTGQGPSLAAPEAPGQGGSGADGQSNSDR